MMHAGSTTGLAGGPGMSWYAGPSKRKTKDFRKTKGLGRDTQRLALSLSTVPCRLY